MTEDYKVGYGRPPKNTQFKKGRSGNPNGRPKGSPNLETAIRKAASQKVQVRMGDKTKRMPATDAIAQKLINNALKGDIRAVRTVAGVLETKSETPKEVAPTVSLTPEDLEILHDALEKEKRTGKENGNAEKVKNEEDK